MRACTVSPGKPETAGVEDISDPPADAGDVLVEGLLVGVCGTDVEITTAGYGWPPPGHQRLVLFHESLGRVLDAPADSGFAACDLVVGIVRRPDPVPCVPCSRDNWDFCRNGQYTERGIKEIDGYASTQWVVEPDYAVKLDSRLADVGMLLEPTTVVAKAWEQAERIGARAWFEPSTVLVTGAGPIGLLAAMLGTQRGLDVHVLDQVTSGPKPGLVQDIGATYHHDDVENLMGRLRPDIVLEATGVAKLVVAAMSGTASYGIVVLTGVSSGGRTIPVDTGELNRDIVLENDAVVGSVNANLRHYAQAAEALAKADLSWLERLVTRRVPLESFAEAFEAEEEDVKVVLDLTG
jgi:glucose 1-dehydrogenase